MGGLRSALRNSEVDAARSGLGAVGMRLRCIATLDSSLIYSLKSILFFCNRAISALASCARVTVDLSEDILTKQT